MMFYYNFSSPFVSEFLPSVFFWPYVNFFLPESHPDTPPLRFLALHFLPGFLSYIYWYIWYIWYIGIYDIYVIYIIYWYIYTYLYIFVHLYLYLDFVPGSSVHSFLMNFLLHFAHPYHIFTQHFDKNFEPHFSCCHSLTLLSQLSCLYFFPAFLRILYDCILWLAFTQYIFTII